MGNEPYVETAPHTCQYCSSKTRDDIVNMALWEGGGKRLIIIADVPARICEQCYEQFYDDNTLYKIDKLRAIRFPVEKAREVIQVPVFSLTGVAIEIETSNPINGSNPKDAETPKGVFTGYKEIPSEI